MSRTRIVLYRDRVYLVLYKHRHIPLSCTRGIFQRLFRGEVFRCSLTPPVLVVSLVYRKKKYTRYIICYEKNKI